MGDIQPELAPIGWVTKNGFEPLFVPKTVTKDPHRIIHVSRPERGLGPLLAMWPALKARVPQATLQICRYASMYDGEGSNVRAMCETFDRQVQQVQAEVGGIEYLGSLNKPQLYQAIAEAAVMWYPGIATFAETSCIAAIEAQACGTPFVGSLKGALPETAYPSFEAGLLIAGNAERDEEYQRASVDAVVKLLDGCARQSFEYRKLQKAGLAHVKAYTYAVIADEWEAQIDGWFRARYKAQELGVMRQLLHEDDHTAAEHVANDIVSRWKANGVEFAPAPIEAIAALDVCERVLHGRDHTPEDYAAYAIQDPLFEAEHSGRIQTVAKLFGDCTRVLDIACGNGAGAIAMALANSTQHVVGIDYAVANIEHAQTAAETAGVADRVSFICAPVWDIVADAPAPGAAALLQGLGGTFDGLFVGEFVEHVVDCARLIDFLDTFVADGALCLYTCPSGPFRELLWRGQPTQRTHVHHFTSSDVEAVWGPKAGFGADFFSIGQTGRFAPVGHWVIHYRKADGRPAGQRRYADRIVRTRPQQKLSVGLIAKDAENDLARCLASVWHIADEILIGDTGSTDTTKALAAEMALRRKRTGANTSPTIAPSSEINAVTFFELFIS